MVYPDTSFLFSTVLHDSNTLSAFAYLRANPQSIVLTPWQKCELRNAIRLSVFKKDCDGTVAGRALEKISSNIAEGHYTEMALVWPDVLTIADELSEKHTLKLGVRTLDLLHVAAALSLNAKTFLTCDRRQVTLAGAAGLNAVII
ncbi:MAG: PIN domain-containing protein [Verrucomicrobia bacterium]|nr:PIN domain-containing protein [Verrucomicrobiota bacterium]